LRWALTGQLARNWYGVRAHLMRLQGASDLIQAARLALWIFPLDLAASAALVVGLTLRMSDPSSVNNEFMYLFSAAIATVFLVKMYWAFWGMLAIIARIYVIGIMAFGFAIFSIVDAPWNWSDLAHLSGLVFITIGLLYLGFWGPAAARCVKAGLFTHFRWWPLVPLVYLNDAYEGMRRIIPLILTDLKKTVRYTLTAILLIAFYIALMFGMEHYVPEIADAMRYLVFGVFVFMFLIPLCYTCTLFIKDYLKFKRFDIIGKAGVDPQGLNTFYDHLDTGFWRVNLLRQIRNQNKLIADQDNEHAIRKLLRDVESKSDI